MFLTDVIFYLELNNFHNGVVATTQNKLVRPGLVTDRQVKLHQLYLHIGRNSHNKTRIFKQISKTEISEY